MNERTILIVEYLSGDFSVSELARRRGISRQNAWKWIERFKREGWDGLKDRSRAPQVQANAVAPEMEQRILELKAEHPLWGAPKIHTKLARYGDRPAESTVSNILNRHGLTRSLRRRPRATPSPSPLSHCQGPNEVWSADFKGWFRTGDGRRCDPLTISDAHSRYLLCCQGIGTATGWLTVRPLFEATFREYGLPAVLRTDNGPPFASSGLGGLTPLSVWWLQLGLGLERIEPGQPQQNGRHERMHRTLKEATAQPPRATLRAQQRAFDAFRQEYNDERPHEALGQKPPASVYQPSARDYPARVAQPEYPPEWPTRKVSPGGQMRWKNWRVQISHALVGHTIGLQPIEDGLWTLYFGNFELGQWDERQRRVWPVEKLPPVRKP
jgi:transposase InsO family protein